MRSAFRDGEALSPVNIQIQPATLTPAGVSASRRAGMIAALGLAVFGLVCANPATCVAIDTNGLVAWWTADGNALDAAGSHSGTLSGGVVFAPGVQGQAFSFNGTDSYVQVPDAPDLHLPSTLSLAFWARRQQFGVDIVAEKGGDWTLGGTAFGVGLHSINNNQFYFFYAGGWQGTPGVNDLEWHHYVVTAQQGQAHPRFFVDGAERAAVYGEGTASVNLYPSTQPLHLGAQVGSFTYYGQLQLDDLMLFNRILSPDEVRALYLMRLARLSITPVAAGTMVSWPTNYDTGVLEAKGSLLTSVPWATVSGTAQISGTNFVLTNGLDVGTRFYQLRLP